MEDRLQHLAINEQGFIFDPLSGTSYTTNETGIVIIDCLKNQKDSAEIVATLVQEFEVTEQEAQRDLTDFMNQLHLNKLA